MQEKRPPERVLAGTGTYADPFKVRNDLAWACDQIIGQGYDYEAERIRHARHLVEACELSADRREYWTKRIDFLEYRSKGSRTGYLIRRHKELLRDLETYPVRIKLWESSHLHELSGIKRARHERSVTEQKRLKQIVIDRILREADQAYQDFLSFAEAHPELVKRDHDTRFFLSPAERLATP